MVVEAIFHCVACQDLRLNIAVLCCMLAVCGSAHAEPAVVFASARLPQDWPTVSFASAAPRADWPTLPVRFNYVPAPGEPAWDSIDSLGVVLSRYRHSPELKLQPFNALRAGLRTNEYEDQRRAQRTLVKSDLGSRSQGAQSGLLDGDLASVAGLAATYFSFNLTLRGRRRAPHFFMDNGGSRPPWAVGVGLGRVGLGLRTEF